jgi:hypothetical protein
MAEITEEEEIISGEFILASELLPSLFRDSRRGAP